MTVRLDRSPSEIEKQAVRALKLGEFGFAEMLAWTALDQRQESPTALTILAAIAGQLNLPEAGLEFLRRAAAIDPALPKIGSNELALIQILANQKAKISNEKYPRYLLIRAWGCGFWSDVSYVAVQTLLAELTNRIPVIHWGYGSLYNNEPPKNCYPMFFHPPSAITVDDLVVLKGRCFPEWWQSSMLSNAPAAIGGPSAGIPASNFLASDAEIAISDYFTSMSALKGWILPNHPLNALSVRELWHRQLRLIVRPVDEFRNASKKFIADEFGGSPYIAVHGRGSDKVGEISTDGYESWVESCIAEWTRAFGNIPIFVLTDEEKVLQYFLSRFGARIHHTRATRSTGTVSVQHDSTILDRQKLGGEVLTDTLIAAGAVAFAGLGWSNVSCVVAYHTHWADGHCKLYGKNQLDGIVKTIYDPRFQARDGSRPMIVKSGSPT